MPPNAAANRLSRLQHLIPVSQLWLVSRSADVSYLTGLHLADVPGEREAFLLLSRQTAVLQLHPFLAPPPDWPKSQLSRSVTAGSISTQVQAVVSKHNLTRVDVDLADLTAQEYLAIQRQLAQLPLTKIELLEWDRMAIKSARQLKTVDELRHIQQAIKLARQVAVRVRSWLKPGLSEVELAARIDASLLRLDSAGSAFPTLVAFGVNTCQPHHLPDQTKLALDQPVLVDFGAVVNGYRSDLTRSWWFGTERPIEYWRAWQAVRAAFRAGVRAATVGAALTPTPEQVDQAVRQVLRQHQLEQFFVHTSGHGVGLEIHEPPSLRAGENTPLLKGMVVTIEPGVYLPNKFGVRWEESVIIGSGVK